MSGRFARILGALVLLGVGTGLVLHGAEPVLNEAEDALLKRAEGLAPAAAAALIAAATVPDSSAALPFARGVRLLQAGDQTGALQAFRDACDRLPAFHRARLNVAKMLISETEYAAAAAELRRLLALEHGLDAGELWFLLAQCNLQAGQALAAEAACRQAVIWRPDDGACRLLLIQALAEQGRLNDAAVLARQEVLKETAESWLWGVIANAELQAGNTRQAMAVLELARRFAASNDSMQQALFELFLSEKLYRLAAAQLAGGAVSGAATPVGLLLHGAQALLDAGAANEARRVLAKLVDGSELTAAQRTQLGRLRAQLAVLSGDAAGAKEHLRQVLSADPLDGEALMALGRLHQDESHYADAVACFERALLLPAQTWEARVALARTAMAMEQWDLALQQLQDAQKLKATPELDESIRQVDAWIKKQAKR